MKKLLLIIACLFLIGCQTNDEPGETPDETTNGVEDVDDDLSDNDDDTENQDDHDDTEDPANGENDGEDPAEDNENDNEGTDTDPEPDSEITDPEEDDPVDHVSEEGPYTSDEAIILVQDYIQGTGLDTELNFSYDGDDEHGNYRIQVFEVVDHGGGDSHTATYGWYLVDPETGEITDLFNQ